MTVSTRANRDDCVRTGRYDVTLWLQRRSADVFLGEVNSSILNHLDRQKADTQNLVCHLPVENEGGFAE
jgi:hypothetical protein